MSDEAVAGKPVAASFRCGCWLWMRLISGHREVCLCGLDRCVCRWAAARPRDRRTRAFGSESSISKPGQALPPPTGTLHTGGAFHCCAHPIQASPPTGTAAKLHSQASLVPQLTRCPPHRRCLVCWWVIGVVLKPGQVLPPPTGTAVGHQPGAVCPALVSNLARWGCSIRSWLAACRRRVAALMMSFPPF